MPKTLTWTSADEAWQLVGRKVTMSPTGVTAWGDQARGRTGVITSVYTNRESWCMVAWGDGPPMHMYRSGELSVSPVVKQNLLWPEDERAKKAQQEGT